MTLADEWAELRDKIAAIVHPEAFGEWAQTTGDPSWVKDQQSRARDKADSILKLIEAARQSDGGSSGEPCGGCGETDPHKRCVGCLHDFSAKGAAK